MAFDPGAKNLGVWAGRSPELTEKLGRFDIKAGGRPAYEAVTELLRSNPWMSDPALVAEAVVETQAPRNVPARIIAVAIYSFLRGMGVPVRFSGAHMKDAAMKRCSQRCSVPLLPKPPAGSKASARYRVNKKNSVAVAGPLLGPKVVSMFGRKLDDVCDAALLGVGLCMQKEVEEEEAKRK